MAVVVDWSALIPDLLVFIATKCSLNIRDFVAFSSVCSSWRHAAATAKSHVNWRLNMPWLFLCENSYPNQNQNQRSLFDLHDNTSYKVNIPDSFGRRCYGTGSEWILCIGQDRQIHLVNPLTLARLDLPSVHTFPRKTGEVFLDLNDDFKNNNLIRNSMIHKALVVRYPTSSSSILVAIIYGLPSHMTYLSVAKPGDSKWTHIETNNLWLFDAAYFPCLGQILFIVSGGALASLNLRLHDNNKAALVQYFPSPSFWPEKIRGFAEKYYLVESFGNILMVRRSLDTYVVEYGDENNNLLNKSGYVTFDVFKLDGRSKWSEMTDLGDIALFVGNSPATSVVASKFKGCKRNCIYYNDDAGRIAWLCTPDEVGGRDMGVYDVALGTTTPFYSGDHCLSSYSVPVWYLPGV